MQLRRWGVGGGGEGGGSRQNPRVTILTFSSSWSDKISCFASFGFPSTWFVSVGNGPVHNLMAEKFTFSVSWPNFRSVLSTISGPGRTIMHATTRLPATPEANMEPKKMPSPTSKVTLGIIHIPIASWHKTELTTHTISAKVKSLVIASQNREASVCKRIGKELYSQFRRKTCVGLFSWGLTTVVGLFSSGLTVVGLFSSGLTTVVWSVGFFCP